MTLMLLDALLCLCLIAAWMPRTYSVGVDMGDCVCMCDNNDGSQYITPMQGGKFLQSIKGLRGDMGPPGTVGHEGTQGFDGPIGPMGPPGKAVSQPGTTTSVYASCKQLRTSGTRTSGIYRIKTGKKQPKISVFCDMESAGGGWTLVASVHENNIYGKCTSGDNWSSDQGLETNYTGSHNWRSSTTFGQVEGATSADYKSPAYMHMLGSDVMIWHVPNNVHVSDWNAQAFLQYYTTNQFLNSRGGTLQILFSKYFPLEKQPEKGDTEGGIGGMMTSVNNSAADLTSCVPTFYNYNYDQSGTVMTQINDGGNDMYDTGNKVSYKIGQKSYKQIVYGKSIVDMSSGVQIQSLTMHPFTMLMWVGNSGRSVESFEIKVQSGTGADTNGNQVSYDGRVSSGSLICEYHSYNVYGANDPSICEVYFHCSDVQNWSSTAADGFTRSTWSSSTDNLVNAVRVSGRPQNILMGYTLLSKNPGTQVSENQVRAVLTVLMRSFAAHGPIADIDCSRDNLSLAVPVQYIKGDNTDVMNRVPPAQKARVQPGFVHFRPVDPNGVPNAICPGVKSLACFQQSVCIGGIAANPNSTAEIKRACGDFAGWDGQPTDQPTKTQPSGSARSLDDVNSSILIFVR